MRISSMCPRLGAQGAKRGLFGVLVFVVLASLAGCGGGAPQMPLPTPTSWLTLVASSALPASATPTTRVTQAVPTAPPTPLPTRPSRPALIGTLTIGSLPAAGRRPAGIALLGERVYVSNYDSHNVSVIASGAVKAVVPVGRGPRAIVADPASGRVFVLNEGESSLSVLEGAKVVATWSLSESASGLLMVGGELWVAGRGKGHITILSGRDGSTLGEVELSAGLVSAMVAGGDGRRVYAADYARLCVVDVASRREVRSVGLSGIGLLAVAPSGQGLYVSGYDADKREGYLALLEEESLAEVRRVPSVPDLAALVGDPTSGRVYLLSAYNDELVVLDGQSGQVVARLGVGYEPRSMALDAPRGLLYVANYRGDNLVVVDTAKPALVATVPLALRIGGMEADPIGGQLYVAVGSANKVLVLGEAGLVGEWAVGGYPSQVRVIPGTGLIACLSLSEGRLRLLDQTGQVVGAYATGRRPRGLALDEMRRQILAGDTVIQWEQGLTQTLAITTPAGTVEQPVQVVLDVRRNRYYAVAANGVPGSNYGYVATRVDEGVANPEAPAPGRLSIVELIYDEEMDRFYATSTRMGTFGLQVSRAEDCQELLWLNLNRYPQAMALNPATRHVWVALGAASAQAGVSDTQVVVYDTRTFGQVAQFNLDGLVEALAVDPRTNRVYLAVGDVGVIHVAQDVPMEAPTGPLSYAPNP